MTMTDERIVSMGFEAAREWLEERYGDDAMAEFLDAVERCEMAAEADWDD